MSRTIDFDAFRAERTAADPVTVRIGGASYDLPASLPASLALDAIRISDAQLAGEDVKEKDLVNIGTAIFGSIAKFREVLEKGHVGIDELGDLMKMILDAYTDEVAPPNLTTQAQTPPTSR